MMYAAVLKGDFNRENGVDFSCIGILEYESEHIADCVEDVVSDYGEAGKLVQMHRMDISRLTNPIVRLLYNEQKARTNQGLSSPFDSSALLHFQRLRALILSCIIKGK